MGVFSVRNKSSFMLCKIQCLGRGVVQPDDTYNVVVSYEITVN